MLHLQPLFLCLCPHRDASLSPAILTLGERLLLGCKGGDSCLSMGYWSPRLGQGSLPMVVLTPSHSGASQMVLVVKNLPANTVDVRDAGSILGSGRSPGGGHGNPLQCSCLENPMDREPGGLQSIASQRVRHN